MLSAAEMDSLNGSSGRREEVVTCGMRAVTSTGDQQCPPVTVLSARLLSPVFCGWYLVEGEISTAVKKSVNFSKTAVPCRRHFCAL